MKKLIPMLALLSCQTIASPSEEINYLMSTPVSLWDWGRFNIEQKLQQISPKDDGKYIGCSTSYDWDDGELFIRCMADKIGGGTITLEEGKALSSEAIDNVRLMLGYHFSDKYNSFDHMRKKEAFWKDIYPIEQYFENKDFRLVGTPTDLGKTLEKITKISIGIHSLKGGGSYWCEAKLQGGTPLCRHISADEITKAARAIFLP